MQSLGEDYTACRYDNWHIPQHPKTRSSRGEYYFYLRYTDIIFENHYFRILTVDYEYVLGVGK